MVVCATGVHVDLPDVAHMLLGWNAAAVGEALGRGCASTIASLVAARVVAALSPQVSHRGGHHRAGRLNARGDTRVVRELFGVPCEYVRAALAPLADELKVTSRTISGAWTTTSAFAAVFGGLRCITRREGLGDFPSVGFLCPGVRVRYLADAADRVQYAVARRPGDDTVTIYEPRSRAVQVVPAGMVALESDKLGKKLSTAITFKFSRKLKTLQFTFPVVLFRSAAAWDAVSAAVAASLPRHIADKLAKPNPRV